MRRSRVALTALVLMAFGIYSAGAAALDTPQTTLHHSRSKTESHLSSAHHTAAHRATVRTARTATAHTTATASSRSVTRTSTAHRVTSRTVTTRTTTAAHLSRTSIHRRHRYYERFTASSFVKGDIGEGDITTGENPVVRQAAIDALGDMNGTAVVIDPSNGRILAMVNQKLALSPGAEPCSTIKLTVALAALSEGIVTRDTMVQLPGFRMNMTQALAKSNNLYFEELGRELGFERVHHYATEFGLGELAGYNISGEQLGEYPDQPIPEAEGGVGRMCSFGQGVSLTPLQLGSLVAAIANGGTLYYLQHPDDAGRDREFSTEGEARVGHREVHSGRRRWHGGRGGIRDRAQLAGELPRPAGVWEDRNVFGQWHAVWLVCLVFRFARRRPGDGVST